MNAELRHALGTLCVDAPDGLYASPRTTRELADVLSVLKAHGAVMGRDVKLSRGAFDRLEAVEPRSCTAQAGAGITLADLERALLPHALTLGPLSPRALKLTLADFLEGPYAGLRAIPGGRLEPLCICVEAVLHDGRTLKTHFSPRSAAGPDLTALLLGAHGRIGLIVNARVRCLPRPETQQRPRFSFPSIASALDAVAAVLSDGCALAGARAQLIAQRPVLELQLAGTLDGVERDLATLQHRIPSRGGRPAGAPLLAPAVDTESEASWHAIARALEDGHPLDLHRLSLHGAIVRGLSGGLSLETPTRWALGHGLAAAVLGGA